jgi:hypothetical protein
MRDYRISAETWLKVGSVSLVLGVVLLAVLSFDLPATAGLQKPTPPPWSLVHVDDLRHRPRYGFSTPAQLDPRTGPLTEPPCDLNA